MKSNLVGFASDGASVMLGRHQGLGVHFERFSSRPKIYKIHCMAHRLNLVVKKSLSQRDS